MHEIDASFRQKKTASLTKRRRSRRRRWVLLLVCLLAVGAGTALFLTRPPQETVEEFDESIDIVPVAEDQPSDGPVYVPALIGLPGDPMIISFGGAASGQPPLTRSLARPAELAAEAGISDRLDLLSDVMLSSSERFITTIPSRPEDFAFFEAQRDRAEPIAEDDGLPDASSTDADADADAGAATVPASFDKAAGADSADYSDPAAGWGETIEDTGASETDLPAFKKTKIEDTTTVVEVKPESERFQDLEDVFVKVLSDRTLSSVLRENGFDEAASQTMDASMKTLLQQDGLKAGFVVAMRGLRKAAGAPKLPVQVSIYAKDVYLGTLCQDDAGATVRGVDPWIGEDLFHYSGDAQVASSQRRYRLLDAIYSTASRNNVPTSVTGEAIMYLSRGQDLNAFAAPDDRLVLLYSGTPRDPAGTGRVLYVAVRGADKTIECFVYLNGKGNFTCVGDDDEVHSMNVVKGMVSPVAGVMTSGFGIRQHPILGVVRKHMGVDWAAPIGTPVLAAFDGTVAFAGNGNSYGNVLRISHPGGRETRYAHLQRFAPEIAAGRAVKAGDVVAFVGTTGRSTGPHLHFELRQGGEAIDPLQTTLADAGPGDSDDVAVERLVNRIVHVESGGKARAKNPLSSATGLGQFIEGTWLRMMRTYRPDLSRSLAREDLLALRFDPDISREMVMRLAQEGEAYLRARGHSISAGRLYLCHFLGMEGAHLVLSAAPDAALSSVLGSGVIGANPFLTGKNAAYVQEWAERKMGGKAPPASSPAAAPAPQAIKLQASPAYQIYKAVLTKLTAA